MVNLGGSGALFFAPYVPVDSYQPAGPWHVPSGVQRPFLPFRNGYWRVPACGARTFDSATDFHWLAWWQRHGVYGNLVQCARYRVTGGQVDASTFATWGSTQDALPGGVAPPRWPPQAMGYLPPLRTELDLADPHTFHSIAIGRVLPGQALPQVVCASMGGRVMVLSGADGRILEESADFGFGGMALALADLTGDGLDEILFAPVYSPIPWNGGSVRSYLHVLSGSTGGLSLTNSVPVGDPTNDDFPGYGACGIAVSDIPGTSISKAILVTTLNGELVVFGQNNGVVNPAPLFRAVVQGSIGAFNSIVIADVDPDEQDKPELYLSGSYGIRRFDFP